MFAQSGGPYAARHMRRLSRILALPVVVLVLAAPSPALAKGPLSSEQTDAVRAYVRDVLDALDVPGAAVVIVGPEGIEFAEGFAATGRDEAPTPQTPFQIASLSKQLTGIAVMQLVDAGDLDLDAPVHSYIDWFGSEGSQTARITVRDLLAHTSGWTERDGLVNRAQPGNDPDAMEQNTRRLADTPLSHPIGQFQYSNANYDVLGYLVAVVSGQTYEDYMAEHVFAPLGMNHTHTDEAASRADGLVKGYYPFFAIPTAWDMGFARSGLPSAYIASSAEDLGHVLIAHLNGGAYGGTQVLDASSMAELRRPLTNPDAWSGYGWGWWTYPFWNAGALIGGQDVPRYDVPIILEHTGSHGNYASGMVLLPDEQLGVVVLMNTDDAVAPSRLQQVDTGIAQILLGVAPSIPAPFDPPLNQFAKVIGLAIIVLMALGVVVAARRLVRWRRDPSTAPGGRRGMLLHLGLPLAVDVGVTALIWWLALDTAGLTLSDYRVLVHHSPDVGLAMALIALLGLGWGLLRTALTLRVLRRGSPSPA
jgi:CubicO group peptidase (beta-lactamase class C family)